MVALQGDVTSKADLQRIANEVKLRSGYLNLLIANAGVSGRRRTGTNRTRQSSTFRAIYGNHSDPNSPAGRACVAYT
jgi:NAD(P)-dependent dehydrogenase (short-subunit alcohol dehydrogenase family)